MLVTMIVIVMMTPNLLDKILDLQESASNISSTENEIFDTKIQISSLSGSPGGKAVNFTLSNVGKQKLWNFDKFDLFITYEADISGTRTMKVEHLVYNTTGSFLDNESSQELQSGYWTINSITNDQTEKRILNEDEDGSILAKLSNPVYTNGKIIVVVSTQSGVLSSSATQLS